MGEPTTDTNLKRPPRAARVGEGIVAFMDIAGFVSVVESRPAEPLWEEMNVMRDGAGFMVGRGELGGDPSKHGLIFVGDAFLAYAFEAEDEILAKFLHGVCSFTGVMLMRGWRLKVGVAFGELLVSEDGTHYLGAAVARAFRLQSALQWYGGVVDGSLASWLDATPAGQRLLENRVIVKASVPINQKRLNEAHGLALGWPRGLSLPEAQLRESLTRIYPPTQGEEHIQAEMRRTMEFYRRVPTAGTSARAA